MKTKLTTLMLGLLILSASINLNAQEPPRGFFGEVQLGAGYLSGTDSQETPATELFSSRPLNPRIDELSGEAERLKTGLPYLNGTVGYRFDERELSIQIGSPGIVLSKGAGRYGTVSAAVNYARATVYRNPYLVGTDRKTTDASTWKIGLGWNGIMSLPVNLNYSLAGITVEDDDAGSLNSALKREGCDHAFELSGMLPLHPAVIILPQFGLTLRDREGGAESGTRYDAGGTLLLFMGKLTSTSGIGYGYTRFDEEHPVFAETREDKELSLMQMFSYPSIFGIEKLSCFAMASYTASDSNINFYDTEQIVVGSGLGYSF